jgi:hypothetical protein
MLDMRDTRDQSLGVLLDEVLSQNIEIIMRSDNPPAEWERCHSHIKLCLCLDQPFCDPVNLLLNIGYFANDCVLLREHGALEDLSLTALDFLLLFTGASKVSLEQLSHRRRRASTH